MTETAKARQNEILMLAMCALLFFGAFQSLSAGDPEYPPSFMVWLEIGLDLGVTGCLAILVAANSGRPATGLSRVLAVLAPLAVLAGVVQLGVRFTSDVGWWTGHLQTPLL